MTAAANITMIGVGAVGKLTHFFQSSDLFFELVVQPDRSINKQGTSTIVHIFLRWVDRVGATFAS